jgi:2-polyprenyl-6-methoxyphenol hydroxylase-like FAD-dependent oxidoreductase
MTSNPNVRHALKVIAGKTEGGTGHVGVISVRQPILEKHLRCAAFDNSYSNLRSSCTVTHIEEDDEWVYCKYSEAGGVEKRVRSKFLVGCDGKTCYTRKQYLEPKGVLMEQISSSVDYAYFFQESGINTEADLDTERPGLQ